MLAGFGNLAWRYREGFNVEFARQFTRELSIPVICVGGWQHRDAIETALNAGDCDAVSAARSFIADPLLYRHLIKDGVPASPCTFCNACVAYAGQAPVDCFEPLVRAKRDAVLRDEIGWRPGQGDPGPPVALG
jgi:2,4-dienoyl-CoA reductase-like NADH-dependent reductase (Old Yellow Enzyme family)